MTIARLTEIARQRWASGAYADCHIEISDAAWAALLAGSPAPRSPLPSDISHRLFDIPVVRDETLQPGAWQLVRHGDQRFGLIRTSEPLVVESGVIDLPGGGS